MRFIFIIFFCSTMIYSQVTRYVDKTGNNTFPFTSWETASTSIQKVIDICEPWDTVLIGKGVFEENLNINSPLIVLGVDSDSTIIRQPNLNPEPYFVVTSTDSLILQNLSIVGLSGNDNGAATIYDSYLFVDNIKCLNFRRGIYIKSSDANVVNSIISVVDAACINIQLAFNNIPNIFVSNNLLKTESGDGLSVWSQARIVFKNNIMLNSRFGSNLMYVDENCPFIEMKNNMIISYFYGDININFLADTLVIHNNSVITLDRRNQMGLNGIIAKNADVRNNILTNRKWGILGSLGSSYPTHADYNLFYKVQNIFHGNVVDGGHNIEANPMFVNADTSNVLLFDSHLQANSPAIDAGDPDILDIDGSRSDMGAFGGSGGETYIYTDLPPTIPKWLYITNVDSSFVIHWRGGDEADFSHFSVYGSDTPSYSMNEVTLIDTCSTNFCEIPDSLLKQDMYFNISATDVAGHESELSATVEYILVGLTPEVTISERYELMQNYPNPFNPNTTIRYSLKDEGRVKLLLYNIQGERVAGIYSGTQSKGYHEVKFYSTKYNLASGIYLLALHVSDTKGKPLFNSIRKLVLLK